MNFSDISPKIQDDFLNLLQNHLESSAPVLQKDKRILPMLLTIDARTESNKVYALQPKNGKSDVDTALEVALKMLKDADFEYALYSYSTKIGLNDGRLVDALKSFIFEKSGLTVVFFTPFKVSGLFKKKVEYEKKYFRGNSRKSILRLVISVIL